MDFQLQVGMTSEAANSISHIITDTWNLVFQVWAKQSLSVCALHSQTAESTVFLLIHWSCPLMRCQYCQMGS